MSTTSIVRLSELEGGRRIDPEYYQPKYILAICKLKPLSTTRLKEIDRSWIEWLREKTMELIVLWGDEAIIDHILSPSIENPRPSWLKESVRTFPSFTAKRVRCLSWISL